MSNFSDNIWKVYVFEFGMGDKVQYSYPMARKATFILQMFQEFNSTIPRILCHRVRRYDLELLKKIRVTERILNEI